MRTPLYAVACAVAMGTVAMGAAATPIVAMSAVAQQGATDGQWRAFASDAGATRYSALDQINGDNVGDLRIAWTRSSVDQSI